MAKMVVYRYATEDYADGTTIDGHADHMPRLTGSQQKAEAMIRDAVPNGHSIRADSIYVWENRELAERLWKKTRKGEHLYELEIDSDDVVSKADLNIYSLLVDLIDGKIMPEVLAKRFWSGLDSPRVEILVKKAIVTRRLLSSSEK